MTTETEKLSADQVIDEIGLQTDLIVTDALGSC